LVASNTLQLQDIEETGAGKDHVQTLFATFRVANPNKDMNSELIIQGKKPTSESPEEIPDSSSQENNCNGNPTSEGNVCSGGIVGNNNVGNG